MKITQATVLENLSYHRTPMKDLIDSLGMSPMKSYVDILHGMLHSKTKFDRTKQMLRLRFIRYLQLLKFIKFGCIIIILLLKRTINYDTNTSELWINY